MKLIGWTSFDSPCTGISVGNKAMMMEALNETLRVLRESGYSFSGEAHQREACGVPVFESGRCLRSSMRGWAMLMALAHTGDEGAYMDYYMDQFVSEEKLPEEEAPDALLSTEEEEGFPYFCTNQDLGLVRDSLGMGMPLMTFDRAVLALYDVMKAEAEEAGDEEAGDEEAEEAEEAEGGDGEE